jgi:hypothetical protein
MSDNKPVSDTKPASGPIEERGIVTDVIAPAISGGVGGAVSAAVGNALNKKDK